ncbi:PREDICTED: receptor-interacting serine/threonine-protein kinase 4-like, partial [Acropora digitifera]|uniref:receptor-interacting serine/threonine-protein kinase 4-like n=1 Tax=Acropora digitifera TaxID=70779 RepID=UPI00077AF705
NLLLRNNADANVQDNVGNTPLHISTRKRFCDISQLLVHSGCKINVRNDDGETPLHSAVGGNNVAHVNLLLRNNADANIQDNQGNTPLGISTRDGFFNISQLLIDSGCNKNLKNREGKTPLHLEPLPCFPPFPAYPGDSQEAKGNEGYTFAPPKVFRRKSFFESEDFDDPWMNQPTMSTLSSPIVSKLKEKKSIEGSGILLEERQELLSSEEPEPAVPRKLKMTKGRTSRVERSGTNRTRCEVM